MNRIMIVPIRRGLFRTLTYVPYVERIQEIYISSGCGKVITTKLGLAVRIKVRDATEWRTLEEPGLVLMKDDRTKIDMIGKNEFSVDRYWTEMDGDDYDAIDPDIMGYIP